MATLAERLKEAEQAYHALQTGTMPRVVVDMDGSKVEFAAANSAKLYQYIQDLKTQSGGVPATYSGPAQFLF